MEGAHPPPDRERRVHTLQQIEGGGCTAHYRQCFKSEPATTRTGTHGIHRRRIPGASATIVSLLTPLRECLQQKVRQIWSLLLKMRKTHWGYQKPFFDTPVSSKVPVPTIFFTDAIRIVVSFGCRVRRSPWRGKSGRPSPQVHSSKNPENVKERFPGWIAFLNSFSVEHVEAASRRLRSLEKHS